MARRQRMTVGWTNSETPQASTKTVGNLVPPRSAQGGLIGLSNSFETSWRALVSTDANTTDGCYVVSQAASLHEPSGHTAAILTSHASHCLVQFSRNLSLWEHCHRPAKRHHHLCKIHQVKRYCVCATVGTLKRNHVLPMSCHCQCPCQTRRFAWEPHVRSYKHKL